MNGTKIFTNSVVGLTTTDFTGGVSVTLTDVLDTLLTSRYHSVIFDYALGSESITDMLQGRRNLTNDIKDGVGFTTINTDITTAETDLALLNFQTLVQFYNLDEMKYDFFPLQATAEIVAIRALRLTTDANIADYIIGNETFGGMNKASLPYFNTPLTFGKPTGVLTEAQLVSLNDVGGSTFTCVGTSAKLSEVLTTYKRDNAGNNDVSWKYLNYVDSMSTIREFFVSNLRSKYSQTRMTDGNLIAGISITNKGAVKAFLVKLYSLLADKGTSYQVGITRSGLGNYFVDNLIIEDDLATGKVTFQCKVPIVVQLRTINGSIEEILDLKFAI